MSATPHVHRYDSREDLAEALAAGVAAVLAGGIATRGRATLAVSGGSTPKLFFEHLSRAAIDWHDVEVLLVDERWVPETSERSNAALVRHHLLQHRAAVAEFVPLHEDAPRPEDVLDIVNERIRLLSGPLDAAVLGMGTDGHTASFFPGTPDLAGALHPENDEPVAIVRAEAAGEPRVTLTLPPLVDARFLALHIEGEAKRSVLERALADGPIEDMPVRAVLRARREHPLEVFWAP